MNGSAEPPRVTPTSRPSTPRPPSPFISRAAVAVGTVLALGGLAEYFRPLAPLRIFHAPPSAPRRESTKPEIAAGFGRSQLEIETRTRSELAQPDTATLRATLLERQASDDPERPVLDAPEPPLPLADASGRALDGFFRALTATRRKQPHAVTRIAHFGDSIVVSDLVSGTLRRKLQAEFGDAGHGFMLIANAWPAYFHNDVTRFATAGFSVSRIVGPYVRDGFYGLGGVSFSAEKNLLARFGTAKSGGFGRAASHFELHYLEDVNGGLLQVSIDGVPRQTIDTRADAVKSRFYTVDVPDGEHEFEVRTLRGVTRTFGVVLERDQPGVVLDALGIQGARIRFLDKQDDGHFIEQLRFRRPNLLIYEFGANESTDGFLYAMTDYHRTMKEVLSRGQRALPDSSCLVIGVMDRAAKVGDELVSLRVIPSLRAEQESVAAEVGCAFFDTYTAMGGARSMPRWVRRGLGQADMTHPTAVGSEVIGNWIFRGLMQAYRRHSKVDH